MLRAPGRGPFAISSLGTHTANSYNTHMKKKIMILFGGESTEHEVSLISGKNIIENIDKDLYDVIPVGITKEGSWYLMPLEGFLSDSRGVEHATLKVRAGKPIGINLINKKFFNLATPNNTFAPDVIFPVLHGMNGEDGSMQGLAQVLGIPIVGCGLLSSAICMNKDITKRLLSQAGIQNAPFLTLRKGDVIDEGKIVADLGLPVFVKAANGGSSVGVNKAKAVGDIRAAVEDSFKYDNKIIIESAVVGREIEISVLGNRDPQASDVLGEIIPNQEEYYSYEAKYINDTGVRLVAPAEISEEITVIARSLAIDVYKTLGCSGMARIDFFLKEDGELVVNEVNTIPGFTSISMYPKLFALSGIDYQELINRLIKLAI